MRLTRECDYAFVVLVFLARQERVMSCEDLAQALGISYDFLAKILQKLARGGLLASKPGQHGGYILARPPSEITFTDVFRAVDDPLLLVECAELENCGCPRLSLCAIVEAMRVAHQKLAAVLDSMTLDELVAASRAPVVASPPEEVHAPTARQ